MRDSTVLVLVCVCTRKGVYNHNCIPPWYTCTTRGTHTYITVLRGDHGDHVGSPCQSLVLITVRPHADYSIEEASLYRGMQRTIALGHTLARTTAVSPSPGTGRPLARPCPLLMHIRERARRSTCLHPANTARMHATTHTHTPTLRR